MSSISISAPAKLNLGLFITGVRPDGFHSLESIFSTVTLEDRVSVSFDPGNHGIHLKCTGIPSPEDSSNIAWKAADLFAEKTGIRGAISINLHKNIPSPGGLGGGSSDAAAVIRALCRLTEHRSGFSGEELGSDVPFFSSGLPAAVVTGRGDKIKPCTVPAYHAVLVNSGENIPTPVAYRLWDEHAQHLTSTCGINNYTALNCGVWHEGKPFPVRLDNHFLSALTRRFPGVRHTADELSALSKNWGLSGSGPVFFTLFRTENEAIEVEEALKGKYPWVFRCRSRHIGASSNG